MVRRIFSADQHEFPDAFQKVRLYINLNNHRLMSGELESHEEPPRLISIRLMFAHASKAIRRPKLLVNGLVWPDSHLLEGSSPSTQ